jgi:hypothetical protein
MSNRGADEIRVEPQIVFLGIAERAAYVLDGATRLPKWNVLGLKHIIPLYFYPFRVTQFFLGLAVRDLARISDIGFCIENEAGEHVISFRFETTEHLGSSPEVLSIPGEGVRFIKIRESGWTTLFLPFPEDGLFVLQSGRYSVNVTTEGPTKYRIGEIHFIQIDAAPLTEERRTAILSEPTSSKAIRLELSCKTCPAKFRVYAALERIDGMSSDGWSWYQDIPNQFECSCGKMKFGLESIRKNLHGLLGLRKRQAEGFGFTDLYEKSSLETMRHEFGLLLNKKTNEEALQQYLSDNPILLHQFPATKIFKKPLILTDYVADFGIVTPSKELVLIELEKASTRLMKKDGDMASDLNHALDQVRNWLHVADEHRVALLDMLKIPRDEVSSVRGVVIAGRDSGYDAQKLRRLKGTDFGRTKLLTYDDLLFAISALIDQFDSL